MAHILIFIHWFVLVFTFGNVELVTIDNSKSNDFPIEELNGYTLREVFQGGNIFTGLASQFDTKVNLTIENENDYLILKPTLLHEIQYALFTFPVENYQNHKIYGNFTVNLNSIGTNGLGIYLTNGEQQNYVFINDFTPLNEWVTHSGIETRLTTSMPIFILSFKVATTDINDFIKIKNNSYIVDMTSFGISNLTVTQMDYWFNVYQENEQREISDTYDYIENELTTNDLIYIVLFALLWGLAIKIVKGVM